MGIKTRQQHRIDNQDVGMPMFLEVLIDALARILIVEVVQDEFCRHAAIAALLQLTEHLTSLRIGLTDYHACQRGIALLDAPSLEILDDIVEQCAYIAFVLQYLVAPHVLLPHLDGLFQMVPHLLQAQAVGGLYVLAQYLLRKAVLDTTVIIIGADIVAKHIAALVLFAYQWRSCKCQANGVGIALKETR